MVEKLQCNDDRGHRPIKKTLLSHYFYFLSKWTNGRSQSPTSKASFERTRHLLLPSTFEVLFRESSGITNNRKSHSERSIEWKSCFSPAMVVGKLALSKALMLLSLSFTHKHLNYFMEEIKKKKKDSNNDRPFWIHVWKENYSCLRESLKLYIKCI